jgi:hypothetical protein
VTHLLGCLSSFEGSTVKWTARNGGQILFSLRKEIFSALL